MGYTKRRNIGILDTMYANKLKKLKNVLRKEFGINVIGVLLAEENENDGSATYTLDGIDVAMGGYYIEVDMYEGKHTTIKMKTSDGKAWANYEGSSFTSALDMMKESKIAEAKKLLRENGFYVFKKAKKLNENEIENPLYSLLDVYSKNGCDVEDAIETDGSIYVGDYTVTYNDNPNYKRGIGFYAENDELGERYLGKEVKDVLYNLPIEFKSLIGLDIRVAREKMGHWWKLESSNVDDISTYTFSRVPARNVTLTTKLTRGNENIVIKVSGQIYLDRFNYTEN